MGIFTRRRNTTFLHIHFNLNITNSSALKISFVSAVVGAVIGFILSVVVKNRMHNYRESHSKKEYNRALIIEISIILFIIFIGIVLIGVSYEKYHDFIYPKG